MTDRTYVEYAGTRNLVDSLGHHVGVQRFAAAMLLLALWYGGAVSGLFFRDVIPTPVSVVLAIGQILMDPAFYSSLLITVWELVVAMLIGGTTALAVGFLLGRSNFAARAYEPWVYYLGPTPKIVIFPVVLMLCGAGPASKMALGALSCFFPLALGIAAATRSVDPILLKVGQSLGLSRRQMIANVYLPAIRPALLNAFRIVFAVTAVGVLLAETKISQAGLGFLVIQRYQQFDIPQMYALLILLVCMVTFVNSVLMRLDMKQGKIR